MTTALPHGASFEDVRWLQRFAVRLARDPDVADDLVQDTLVEAWRDPPPDQAAPIRPWLAAVLRNRFLLRLRGQRRREARQEQAAAPVAPPLPDAEQTRLDVLGNLLDALRSLPADDQKIVVRRYIDDDTAEAIARDLDMPAATVRTRARRALGRLRELLDQRFGDRSTWCAAVLAIPSGLVPAPPPGPTPGRESSASMSLTAKLLLTAAASSTAGIAGWVAMRPPTDTAPTTVAAAPAAPASEPVKPAGLRETWERRRAEIRAVLPPVRPTDEPLEPPEIVEKKRVNEVFRELVRACVDDLETEKTGALTLAIHEIGSPDVGTIFESVEVMHTNFDDPEVVECLTQSMYGYIGPTPDEAFERHYSRTLALGSPKDDDAMIHQIIGRIVGAHIEEIRFCETKGDGEVRGEVTVALTIGDGPRATVAAGPSDLPEPVVTCIVGATERWIFPKLPVGKTFEHTFVLPMPGERANP